MLPDKITPNRFSGVPVLEAFFRHPDGHVERIFLHKIDFEEARRADPSSWGLEPPALEEKAAAVPAQQIGPGL